MNYYSEKLVERLNIAKEATELCRESKNRNDIIAFDYDVALEIIKIQKLNELKNELAKLSK